MPITQPVISFNALITSTALNTAFGTFTTEINRVGGIVDAATNNPTGSALVKRTANGDASLTALTLVGVSTASGFVLNGFAGGDYIKVTASGGAVGGVFFLDHNGNLTMGGNIVSSGFFGPITGNVTGNTSGTAGSLAAPVTLTTLVSDYKVVPSVSAGQVNINGGGAYGDSAGNPLGPVGPQIAILPAQPSGTNIQYLAISLAPVTAAPVVTAGAVGASPARPLFPLGNEWLAMVTYRGATTNPSNVVAAGDIIDYRGLGSGGAALTPVPSLVSAAISDYKATTNASAATITVGAGGAYGDSSGNIVGPLTAQNATLPTQPTGTNFQYVGITLAPGTGAPVVTAASVNAALSTLLLPTANKPVAVVLWKGVTTLPTGIVAAGDITDIRNLGSGGGAAGGAGTDASVRAAQLLLSGTNGILPSALDVTNSASALAIYPTLIRRNTTAGTASFDDVQQAWVQPDAAGRIAKTSANTVTLSSSVGSPFSIRDKKLTASSSAVASGGAGPRYVVFDSSIPGLVTPMPVTNATNPATQTILSVYWWDGSTLQDGLFTDLTPLLSAQSTQLGLVTASVNDGGVTSGTLAVNGGYTVLPTITSGSFYVPVQCRITYMIGYGMTYVAAGSSPSIGLKLALDAGFVGQSVLFTTSGTYVGVLPSKDPIILSPGQHFFNVGFYNPAGVGSTVQFVGTLNSATLYFWKG